MNRWSKKIVFPNIAENWKEIKFANLMQLLSIDS